jgi:fatty acid desaturase
LAFFKNLVKQNFKTANALIIFVVVIWLVLFTALVGFLIVALLVWLLIVALLVMCLPRADKKIINFIYNIRNNQKQDK